MRQGRDVNTSGEPFKAGQRLWLGARLVAFVDYHPGGAAIVRYEGETKTRVVLLARLSPSRS